MNIRTTTLWAVWPLLALLACGRAPESRDRRGDVKGEDAIKDLPPTDPVPPPVEDPPPPPEVKTLTLALGTVKLAPTETLSVYLGDGATHLAEYVDQAAIVFDDVSLPADVTVVVRDVTNDKTAVSTLLGVDKREVDLSKNGFAAALTTPTETPAADWISATISGELALPGFTTGIVRARGAGVKTQTQQLSGTTFTLRAKGPELAAVDLLAVGLNSAGDASFGVKEGVLVENDQTVAANVTLDHVADQLFTVTATNEALFGGVYSSRLVFAPAGSTKASENIFASVVDRVLTPNPPPFVGGHSTPDMTTLPVGVMARRIILNAGKLVAADDVAAMDPAVPFGQAQVEQAPDATDADISFLNPGLVTAPELGKLTTPGAATLPLTLAWSGDDTATLVTAEIRSVGGTGSFSWTLRAAGTVREVTLPELPAAIGVDVIPSGTYQVGLQQKSASAYTAHTDYFKAQPGLEGDTRVTQQWGFLAVP